MYRTSNCYPCLQAAVKVLLSTLLYSSHAVVYTTQHMWFDGYAKLLESLGGDKESGHRPPALEMQVLYLELRWRDKNTTCMGMGACVGTIERDRVEMS